MKPGVLNCCFCFQNALKLTYEHLQFLKFFRGLYPRTPVKGEGKGLGGGGKEREGMEIREGGRNKGGKGKEKEEEGKGGGRGRDRGLGRKERDGRKREGSDFNVFENSGYATEGRGETRGDGRERREGEGKRTQVGKFLDPLSLQNSATPLCAEIKVIRFY